MPQALSRGNGGLWPQVLSLESSVVGRQQEHGSTRPAFRPQCWWRAGDWRLATDD